MVLLTKWHETCFHGIWNNYLLKLDVEGLTVLFSCLSVSIKGTLLGLGQFLATESPLEMMKTAFNFFWQGFFLREIFQFMFWSFGHVGERLDKMAEANFKIYDVTSWIKKINILPVKAITMKIGQTLMWKIFFLKNIQSMWWRN